LTKHKFLHFYALDLDVFVTLLTLWICFNTHTHTHTHTHIKNHLSVHVWCHIHHKQLYFIHVVQRSSKSVCVRAHVCMYVMCYTFI